MLEQGILQALSINVEPPHLMQSEESDIRSLPNPTRSVLTIYSHTITFLTSKLCYQHHQNKIDFISAK